MTIHVGLHTRNLGCETRQMTNPFTREPITEHVDEGVTDAELAKGERVLATANASEPDPDGYRKVEFSGGHYVCIAFGRLGADFQIEGGLNEEIVTLIYQLGIASGMLVTSTIDPEVIAVLPGQHHPGIEERWPNAVNVVSEQSLREWIESEIKSSRIAG